MVFPKTSHSSSPPGTNHIETKPTDFKIETYLNTVKSK